MKHGPKCCRAASWITAGAIVLCFGLSLSFYLPFPQSRLRPGPVISMRLLDRNGVLLREVLSSLEGRCSWVDLSSVSPTLLKVTVAAEDRHFFTHPGVNPAAVLRAFFQNVTSGRIVSGASTISQQLVRNLVHGRRTIPSKILEAWNALRIEKKLTKQDILVQYLNRISYGNQAFGISAAARLYFDKKAGDLSLAESAFLAGLPRSPSALNPFRNEAGAVSRQREILHRTARLGWITAEELDRALMEPLGLSSSRDTFKAPHFCDSILQAIDTSRWTSISEIHTTLNFDLQSRIERLTDNHLAMLEEKNITNAAIVVLDNRTAEVRVLIGSRNFFDDRINGQVNGALSLRQPGSTLKPFTYGLALDSGLTAASLLLDDEIQFQTPTGGYIPRNYDRKFHGLVRIRTALACSYNVPAVSVIEHIGLERLYLFLHSAGFTSLSRGPEHYGVGLTLGNGEVSLLELAQAYSALARGGNFAPVQTILSLWDPFQNALPLSPAPARKTILSPQAAYLLTHILSDNDARIPAFGYHSPLHLPFPCAAKTGTSKDYRDNWTVGYTKRYTVGVWVGNFDASPMHNVSGITGCGPLFRDIMLLLHRESPADSFSRPNGLTTASVCPVSGNLTTDGCPGSMEEIFIQGTEPADFCRTHTLSEQKIITAGMNSTSLERSVSPRIRFPVHGDIFKLDPVLRKDYQALVFRALIPEPLRGYPVEWWINGQKIGETLSSASAPWKLEPGSYSLQIRIPAGEKYITSRMVHFTVLS